MFKYLHIAGPDAKTYLQGQISCDINKLSPGHAMMGCCCNLKGRVQTLFYLFQHENNYITAAPSDLIEESLARLRQYAIFSKIEIKESTEDFDFAVIKTENPSFISEDKSISSISFSLENYFLHIIFGLQEQLKKILKKSPAPLDDWQAALVEAGIVQLNQQSYEKFLPQELNLDKLGALDFNKGCYTGQEIVARLHYRGGLKQHLYRIRIDDTHLLPTYTEIHNADNTLIGHVVNSAMIDGKQQLLAVLRDEAKDEAFVRQEKLCILTGSPPA